MSIKTRWRWLTGFVLTSAVVIFVAALPRSGAAELIRKDLVPGSAYADITYDTKTGLEWLDFEYTRNLNIHDAALGKWLLLGFRVATHRQVLTLFGNAGGNGRYGSSTKYTRRNFRGAGMLLSTLGTTVSPRKRVESSGFFMKSDGVTTGVAIVSLKMANQLGLLFVAPWPRSSTMRATDLGVYLVRNKPKPK